jgi:hypothetical protein
MAKTKTEKIEGITEQIRKLEEQKKQLIQNQKVEERRKRTHRLCKRHGLLENFMPDLEFITHEQFEVFIKTGIDTKYGRKRLADIIAEGVVAPAPVDANSSTDTTEANETKATEATNASVTEATETIDASLTEVNESPPTAEQSGA